MTHERFGSLAAFSSSVSGKPAAHRGVYGLLIARHVPGLIATGDCLAVIADDYAGG